MGQSVKRARTRTQAFGTPARQGHDSSPFYERKLYDEREGEKTAGGPAWCCPDAVNVIHHHDSRNMKHLPDDSVHLMITSPPYNVGKDYDEDLSLAEYQGLLANVMAEVHRVLIAGGRACVNIANLGRSPYIPLHSYVINIAQDCGFLMRGEIIWDKGASAGSSCAWGSWRSASNPVLRDVHEYILVFSKGAFKRPPVKESHQKSSIGRDDFLEHTKSIWRFSAASAKKAGHPAPFPLALPLRLINLYSFIGDIVLDPFIGSGTTAQAAQALERAYVGYEINAAYVALAEEKLRHTEKFL